jgi:hypothetical protein
MLSRIVNNGSEIITALILDRYLNPLTAKDDIKVRIWRLSDGQYLDWSDMQFKAGVSVVKILQALSPIDNTWSPGEYKVTFNLASITGVVDDDTYLVTVVQDGDSDAANVPQIGEIRAGQWVDSLLTKSDYHVLQSFAYDGNTLILTARVWVEQGNMVLSGVTDCETRLYEEDGSILKTMTDSTPDAQGFFLLNTSVSLGTNRSYYAVSTVTVTGVGSMSAGKGMFTVG